jgi:hypothetical protein
MAALRERLRRKIGIAWGRLTWLPRLLPGHLIIGAPECGIAALCHLTRHASLRRSHLGAPDLRGSRLAVIPKRSSGDRRLPSGNLGARATAKQLYCSID